MKTDTCMQKDSVTLWNILQKRYCLNITIPEGKRPLGRPRRRWEDGIRMDLREIGVGGVDWIRLAQDRDRWRAVVECGDEPSGSCATEFVNYTLNLGKYTLTSISTKRVHYLSSFVQTTDHIII
jgi:hypothetical protein